MANGSLLYGAGAMKSILSLLRICFNACTPFGPGKSPHRTFRKQQDTLVTDPDINVKALP